MLYFFQLSLCFSHQCLVTGCSFMRSSLTLYPEATAGRLPYQQATDAQRTQALAYLQQRLGQHFPTLLPPTWARALAEFQPDLLLTATQVQVAYDSAPGYLPGTAGPRPTCLRPACS